MVYNKQTWIDNPDGGTPLSAARLSFIETGIENATLTATQALASVTGNYTGSSLDDRITVLASPQRFSGIDPSGASDSRAGLQTAIAAVPDGGRLIVPPGTYLVNNRLTVTQSIALDLRGVTFINNSFNEVLQFNGGYETVYSVSAQNPTTMTGSAGESLQIIALTLSGSPAWKQGDIVKMVSDDVVPNQATLKTGQHFIVVSVSGSTVNVAGRARDPFTTTVRIARKRRMDVEITGGIFDATSTVMSGQASGNAQIEFNSLIRPRVYGTQVRNAAGPAFNYVDCFQYINAFTSVDYAKNGTTVDNTYGYGVNDGQCEYGLVLGLRANRVRHAFTTAFGSVAAAGNLALYGRSYGTTVAFGVAFSTTQTGWDTHNNADSITFLHLQSYNCYAGMQFRGIRNNIVGGLIRGGGTGGGVVLAATSGCTTYGNYLGGGVVIDGVAGNAFTLTPSAGSLSLGANIIDHATVRNVASGKNAIYASNSTTLVGDLWIPDGGGVTTSNATVSALPRLAV